MSYMTSSQVLTLGAGDVEGHGTGHFVGVKIDHESGVAALYGFQLDQYELDSYTMWINEVMERHGPTDG